MLSRIFGSQSLQHVDVKQFTVLGATGANAVITIPAPGANRKTVVHGVQWSYSGDPTTGHLNITDGTNNFDVDIMKGGPGALGFVWTALYNTQLVITLTGVGALNGYLNAQIANET